MTRDHRYNRPDRGKTDWHVPLNENFERLEKDVEIRDEEANRREYRPKRGAKFRATDTHREFLGDGSEWHPVASSGVRPSFKSVSAQKINDEHYVPAGEEVAGIQDVLDDAKTGAIIELEPNGEYVGKALTIDDRIVINGNGATLRLEDGANTDLVRTSNPEQANVTRCKFSDLNFHGNKSNNDSGNTVYGAFWQSRFINCDFAYAPERALWLAGSSESTDDNVFEQCRFLESGDRLESGEWTVQMGYNKETARALGVSTFHRCWFGANRSAVLNLRGNAHTINNCKFYSNDGPAVQFDRSNHSILTNSEMATTTEVDSVIRVIAKDGVSARRNLITGNIVSDSFTNAIHCVADGNAIVGCGVHDNVVDATGKAKRGFLATGTDSFRTCSLQGNIFAGTYDDTPIVKPPSGWVSANNVT